MATRFVSDQPLRVAPEIVGRPLASPMQRATAFVLDWLILVLPTLAVTTGGAALYLRTTDPAAYRALRVLMADSATPEALRDARKDVAALLTRVDAPGLPPAVAAAVTEGRLDDAATALADRKLTISVELEGGEAPVRPGHVKLPVVKLMPVPVRVVVLYGLAALYFTLLTSLWNATLGKRLLGVRVVRLDAERLSLLESFERFTGYLHIPALLGWPILDLWRNPNRQLPHDRTVHTVVMRSRSHDRHAAPPAPPDARAAAETSPPPEAATPLPDSEPASPPEPER